MGRWVLLKHDMPDGTWHYDWMLQRPGSGMNEPLITFRVNERPDDPRVWEMAAERLPDHRAAYLEYEGEVTGGRGRVRRIAQGACLVMQDDGNEFRVHMLDAPARQWIGIVRGAGSYHMRAE